MSSQPAPELLASMNTVGKVLEWVPLPEPFAVALCTALGCAAGDPVRALASIAEEDIEDTKKTMKIGDRLLNPVEKGKVVSSWRTARLAARMEKSSSQVDKEKEEATEAAKTKLALLKEQVEIQRKSITNTVRQVSLSETLDQTRTGTIPMLPQARIAQAHKEYETVTDGGMREG